MDVFSVLLIVALVMGLFALSFCQALRSYNVRSWNDFMWLNKTEKVLRDDAQLVAAKVNEYLSNHPIYPDREIKVRLHDVDVNEIEFSLTIDLNLVSREYQKKAEKDLTEIVGRKVSWIHLISVRTPEEVKQRLTDHVMVGN